MNNNIKISELLEAGAHFGHQTRRWNPKMSPYIFGAKNGVHIINLEKTLAMFNTAYNFLVDLVGNGDKVLFVGTKRQARDYITEEAKRCSMFYVANRWLGGTLTNFRTIKKSIDFLKKIEEEEEKGFQSLSKKEIHSKKQKIDKLTKLLGGIKEMNRLPGAVFVIDSKAERIAISEAVKLNIPIVAVVDTNCDPTEISFPIPGNDDAISSIRLFSTKIADACLRGEEKFEEKIQMESKEEEIPKVAAPRRTIKGGVEVEVGVVKIKKEDKKPEAIETSEK